MSMFVCSNISPICTVFCLKVSQHQWMNNKIYLNQKIKCNHTKLNPKCSYHILFPILDLFSSFEWGLVKKNTQGAHDFGLATALNVPTVLTLLPLYDIVILTLFVFHAWSQNDRGAWRHYWMTLTFNSQIDSLNEFVILPIKDVEMSAIVASWDIRQVQTIH